MFSMTSQSNTDSAFIMPFYSPPVMSRGIGSVSYLVLLDTTHLHVIIILLEVWRLKLSSTMLLTRVPRAQLPRKERQPFFLPWGELPASLPSSFLYVPHSFNRRPHLWCCCLLDILSHWTNLKVLPSGNFCDRGHKMVHENLLSGLTSFPGVLPTNKTRWLSQ